MRYFDATEKIQPGADANQIIQNFHRPKFHTSHCVIPRGGGAPIYWLYGYVPLAGEGIVFKPFVLVEDMVFKPFGLV